MASGILEDTLTLAFDLHLAHPCFVLQTSTIRLGYDTSLSCPSPCPYQAGNLALWDVVEGVVAVAVVAVSCMVCCNSSTSDADRHILGAPGTGETCLQRNKDKLSFNSLMFCI